MPVLPRLQKRPDHRALVIGQVTRIRRTSTHDQPDAAAPPGYDHGSHSHANPSPHRTKATEHAPARMKTFKILRDYRRAAHTVTDTASGVAHLHNIILAG